MLITMIIIGFNVAVFIAVLLFTRDPGALTGSVTDAHLDFGLSREVLAQQIAWQRVRRCLHHASPVSGTGS